MNGKLTNLTESEWIAEKSSRQGLSKAEARKRYNQYLLTTAVGGPNYKTKRQANRQANNTGSKKGNPGGYKKTLGSISECTRSYARALMDPWSITTLPCIPDNIVLPSYKFGCRSYGKFTIGTNGVGWVNFIPLNAYNGFFDFPSSLQPVYTGLFTGITYASTSYEPNLGSGGGVFKYLNDSSLSFQNAYDLNANPEGFQFRLVGAAVKCRYMGTEISRAGRIISYRHPTNDTIGYPQDSNGLLKNKETSSNVNSREWHYATFKPSNPVDLVYRGRNGGASLPTSLLLYVDGGTAGTTFEFECQQWFEVIGQLLPSYTKSHSDILGMAAVTQALPMHQPTHEPQNDFKTFFDDVVATGKNVFSFIGDYVIPAVSTVAAFL